MVQEPRPLARPASLTELFIAFTALALQGFGGVLAIAQRVLCEDRRWLTREEFVEILAVGQVLPGPNVVNVALMIGDRFFGLRGALVALAGMLSVPLVLVLAIAAVYTEFAHDPAVAGALRGMGAVAAGMIVGTALKLTPVLRGNPMGRPACVLIAALGFVCIALLRWPLLWVLPILGSAACVFAWGRLGGR
jgi:chromate transporter